MDYLDGTLDEIRVKELENHIKECSECRNTIESMKVSIGLMSSFEESIEVPEEFMNETMSKLKKRKGKLGLSLGKRGKMLLVALCMCMAMTLTVIGIDAFKVIIHPVQETIESERNTLDNLIKAGYGEELNISVIDKDIKITIEKVLGDELNTVVTYTIEDLKNGKLYETGGFGEIEVEGDFYRNKEEIEFIESLKEHDEDLYKKQLLYPVGTQSVELDEKNKISRGHISLNPIEGDSGNVKFRIKEISIKDQEKIEGNWEFEFQVEKVKSKVYNFDKSIKIDDNILNITKVEVAPTATLVDYNLKLLNKEYNFKYFPEIYLSYKNGDEKIRANERLFGIGEDIMIEESEDQSEYQRGQWTFDSMYLENPKKIDLNIEDMYVYYNDYEKIYFEDVDKLPYELGYKGNKIIIKEMNIEENKTTVIMEDYKNNFDYDRIEVTLISPNDLMGESSVAYYVYNNKETGEEAEIDAFYNSLIRNEINEDKLEFIKNKYFLSMGIGEHYDEENIKKFIENGVVKKEDVKFKEPLKIEFNGYYKYIDVNKKIKLRLNN